MSLDVWPAGLIEGKKKGQGRIGLALLDDVFIKATGYRDNDCLLVAAVDSLPGCLLISLIDN